MHRKGRYSDHKNRWFHIHTESLSSGNVFIRFFQEAEKREDIVICFRAKADLNADLLLLGEIKQFGFMVSDNAVRKWVKAYERDAA